MRRLLIMAVTAVLTALAPAAARESALPVVPSIRDPAFQAEILNAHNRERRPLGVAPLVWSDVCSSFMGKFDKVGQPLIAPPQHICNQLLQAPQLIIE